MILFDLTASQPSVEARFHGGAEYTKIVFEILAKSDAKLICVYHVDLELDDRLLDICKKYSYELLAVKGIPCIEYLLKVRSDVLSFVSCMPYRFAGLQLSGKRFVAVVHGLRELELPFDMGQLHYENGLLRKARALLSLIRYRGKALQALSSLIEQEGISIVTDSLHSKHSILSFFPKLKASQVRAIYAPLPLKFEVENTPGSGEYYLMISANRWVKNCYRAIKAFDQYFTAFPESNKRVVVLGAGDVDCLRNVTNSERFEYVGYVEEEKLWRYHKNAFCFIYPTLNEGFGYPPLASMAYGVPVIASAISSVTEVCGDAALYFNPYSVSEMKNRIHWLETEVEFRKELVDRGKARYLFLKFKCTASEPLICDVMLGNCS